MCDSGVYTREIINMFLVSLVSWLCKTGKEDTVLNRLHIGHFYFMHSFLLKKEEPHVCTACNTTITVKHTLIEGVDLVGVRKKYFQKRSLDLLFQNVNPEKNFDYLKEIGYVI